MADDDLCFLNAVELARLVRERAISPVELIDAHLARIEALNPKINAATEILTASARETAKAAEQAVLRGDPLAPLHGVPFSTKDAIALAGVPSARGSKLLVGQAPDRDATVVARMKQAGAIPLIKTNIPEFSLWWETDNLVHGRTNNPWDLDRTPGGSSGGESAAIAAGMSPLGLGSDVGISVRGPAMFTGIVALKPTHGRIPLTGHWPQALARWWHIGPMARSIADVSAAFDLLSGPDGEDGYAIHAPGPRLSDVPPSHRPLRVGWMAERGFGLMDDEVVATVARAAETLAKEGHVIEPVRLAILEQTDWTEPAITLWSTQTPPYLAPVVEGRLNELSPVGARQMGRIRPSADQYAAAESDVERLRSAFAGYFRRYDALLCPVIPFPAPKHGEKAYSVKGQEIPTTQIMRATVPFNLTGLPALSVPFGFNGDGMPLGVQLVTKWLDEATALTLGLALERANSSRLLRPPITSLALG